MGKHITLIGAGFCGAALVRELAYRADASTRITLVGMADSFGSGVAYGAARPEHLLNVRARDLGIDPDEPGGFADALHLGQSGRQAFLPRLAYADYLRGELSAAMASAAAHIVCKPQEAIAAERTQRGYRIFLANGEAFDSDQLVLAVGALAPQALPGIGPRLSVHPRYIGWPWQPGALDGIAPDARVLIVGTGLTMVDVALSLQARGHTGGLHAISRRGLVPQAHEAEAGPALELPLAVQQALRAGELTGVLRGVHRAVRAGAPWRGMVDALRPHLQPLWRKLDGRRRASFLRHLRPYWEAARHRVAPAAAGVLADLRARGQLELEAARLLRARWTPEGLEAVLRRRGEEDSRTERYDVLIRATGLDTDIDRTSDPLIAGMREAGLLQADPLGLGVVVDEDFRVHDAAGRALPGLYCIGPLLRGALWEITAVPELRVAARKLARHLLEPARAVAAPRTLLRVVG
ncbi:FAD/NAD(P)-binding protein [Stenotrophomonas sp. HITSZ_GD]|uniref:FAD/NAD(P)-binding protein n=1 Tax=Stenotrophomonas sp. HITSZ_GD TaxID=3037248 RepID=UPI00240E43EF|nr:FAD/NAD(P)-binding protein [Stenotrophomonas sp. HITSZ_GD]MDG2526076.1 FAD/NAD(P)-binding protein [Stenotrophomonas sp. HITSZ_GD]